MNQAVVHPSALPNELPVERLRRAPDRQGSVAVDPLAAGWRYLSFRTGTIAAGRSIAIGRPGHETALVLLFGTDLLVMDRGPAPMGRTVLAGRPTAFDGRPSAVYLPVGSSATVTTTGAPAGVATVAIAEAPSRLEGPSGLIPRSIRPDEIRTEIRGAGRSTRQIHHIVPPDFPAERLLLVEVVTPAGNWSSWPPHKHDRDDMPDEAVLEEVYHYRFRRPEAWAIQRVYRPPGGAVGAPRDAVFAVRDGEVVLVTDGYHPFAATDADDAYYLNALAGDRRTMACSFDPDLDAVRSRWAGEAPDPRLPMGPPPG
ncbi:MAG: 5-deoxy-glucuronate isomerase [Candidatus Limnocylindrales bacterium]